MARSSRKIIYEIVALALAVIALTSSFNSTAAVDSNPWKQVVHGEDGRVIAGSGEIAPGVPLFLTVSTGQEAGRFMATTTYVRGKETLRMERVYDASGGLDVTYSTKSEEVRLLMRREPATAETELVAILPDGEVRSITMDGSGHVLAGDPRGWHEALLAKTHMMPLVREFERHAASLGGPVPEAGHLMMWKIPDGPCLDSCAAGCRFQCAFECSVAILIIPCATCQAACAAGCAIGCAS